VKFSVPRGQVRLAAVLVATSFSLVFGACSSAPPAVKAVIAPPGYTELMASAEEAHRKGGVVEAMGFYERAAKADPSKKQPWSRIAQAQFDARNYGSAISAAQEVLQRDTTDVTAKSIMAVSGLRVSANALEQLRLANAVGGSAREEAQTLARIMRDSLGEAILPPIASVPVPQVADKPLARPYLAPRRSSPGGHAGGIPAAAPAGAAPGAPAATAPSQSPNPEPKRNPFDALKG
jgi:hypothetical protein